MDLVPSEKPPLHPIRDQGFSKEIVENPGFCSDKLRVYLRDFIQKQGRSDSPRVMEIN